MSLDSDFEPRWINVSVPSWSSIANDGVITIPLATTALKVSTVPAILSALGVGSAIAFTLFTISHAIVVGRKKRRKRRNIEKNQITTLDDEEIFQKPLTSSAALELFFYKLLLDDFTDNYESSLTESSNRIPSYGSEPIPDNHNEPSSVLNWFNLEDITGIWTNSIHSVMSSFPFDFNVLIEMFSTLLDYETEDIDPENSDIEPQLDFEVQIVMNIMEETGETMSQYVSKIYSNMTVEECVSIEAICSIAVQMKHYLSPKIEGGLRSLNSVKLSKRAKKNKSTRLIVVAAAVLLYSRKDSCHKISDECASGT